jgi:hypothetical protein
VGSIPKLSVYNKQSLGENKLNKSLLFLILKTNQYAAPKHKCLETALQNVPAVSVMSYAQTLQPESPFSNSPATKQANHGFD